MKLFPSTVVARVTLSLRLSGAETFLLKKIESLAIIFMELESKLLIFVAREVEKYKKVKYRR